MTLITTIRLIKKALHFRKEITDKFGSYIKQLFLGQRSPPLLLELMDLTLLYYKSDDEMMLIFVSKSEELLKLRDNKVNLLLIEKVRQFSLVSKVKEGIRASLLRVMKSLFEDNCDQSVLMRAKLIEVICTWDHEFPADHFVYLNELMEGGEEKMKDRLDAILITLSSTNMIQKYTDQKELEGFLQNLINLSASIRAPHLPDYFQVLRKALNYQESNLKKVNELLSGKKPRDKAYFLFLVEVNEEMKYRHSAPFDLVDFEEVKEWSVDQKFRLLKYAAFTEFKGLDSKLMSKCFPEFPFLRNLSSILETKQQNSISRLVEKEGPAQGLGN